MTHEHSLSYASGLGEDPLIGRTIGDDLARTVERLPGHEALVDVPTGQRWTYSELKVGRPDRLGAPARRMRRASVSASGRRTAAEWVLAQYATARIGAVLVNINPAYRTPRAAVRAEPVSVRLLIAATDVQDE